MPDNSANNKRIARNTAFLYIRMLFVLVINLYTSRVILKNLGVEDYGIYNVVAGFISMFAFINTSMSACIQRYYNFEKGKRGDEGFRDVYKTSCIIQLLLAVLIITLVETFGIWFLNHKLVIPTERFGAAKILFHFATGSMAFVVLQVPYSAAIMAHEKMDYYALVGILDVLLKLGIVIALPYLPYDRLVTYSFLLGMVSLIDFFFYFVYAKCRFKEIKGISHLSKSLFKEMLSFSCWSMFGSFAQVIRNQGLNIVLNMFFGPVVNAARGISFQVKGALIGLVSNISTSAQPQIVESYAQGDINRSKNLMTSISKICFFLLFMMSLPIICEVDFILDLWLDGIVPEYTKIFTILILVISLIDVFNRPTTILIYATGKISIYNIITSFIGLLVLPLAYFALKIGLGPTSVYFASILVSTLVMLASIIRLKKTTGITIKYYLLKILWPCIRAALCSIIIPLIVIMLLPSGWLRFLISCVTAVISVGGFAFITGLSISEKVLVKSLINKMLKK